MDQEQAINEIRHAVITPTVNNVLKFLEAFVKDFAEKHPEAVKDGLLLKAWGKFSEQFKKTESRSLPIEVDLDKVKEMMKQTNVDVAFRYVPKQTYGDKDSYVMCFKTKDEAAVVNGLRKLFKEMTEEPEEFVDAVKGKTKNEAAFEEKMEEYKSQAQDIGEGFGVKQKTAGKSI